MNDIVEGVGIDTTTSFKTYAPSVNDTFTALGLFAVGFFIGVIGRKLVQKNARKNTTI